MEKAELIRDAIEKEMPVERLVVSYIKEGKPRFEVTTFDGDYIVRYGGLEWERFTAEDVTSYSLLRGDIERKRRQGYVVQHLQEV